jgi:transmembrane sensor
LYNNIQDKKSIYLNTMKPDPNEQYGEEQASRIAYLISGYLRQTLSEKEHDELDEWMTASDDNQRLFEELTDPKNIEKGLKEYGAPDTEAALKRIKRKIQFTSRPAKQKSISKKILRYSIAASIVLIAGTIMIFLLMNKKDKPEISKTEKVDIQPGGNKARLMIANGKVIDLEKARNGLLDSAEGNEVLKTAEGQLSYESNTNKAKGYHILTTPVGGQYQVTLPDGTRVWLNAESSLKYPVVFGGERVVELTGEGYFEAAPSDSPQGGGLGTFVVKLDNGTEVRVLGTSFNIMAYNDEAEIKTTLLEGRVKIGRWPLAVGPEIISIELKPGEQAQADKSGSIKVNTDVNVDEAVAWKNGQFKFKDQPIEVVMRQVARWYDAEVVYEGKKTDYHFNATIYRKEPVSKLLELLEATNRVHFVIEGKKIVVRE